MAQLVGTVSEWVTRTHSQNTAHLQNKMTSIKLSIKEPNNI